MQRWMEREEGEKKKDQCMGGKKRDGKSFQERKKEGTYNPTTSGRTREGSDRMKGAVRKGNGLRRKVEYAWK